ncbi:unnamed protein product [Soboliphyme baturini]|uniref:Uncharacterized protein n=1 Tax=Soboliphyme baturini TaxID=241478 RepID=A0A183INC2_9BILA|nr:unnamed protein product [Soboliphyme baturini]
MLFLIGAETKTSPSSKGADSIIRPTNVSVTTMWHRGTKCGRRSHGSRCNETSGRFPRSSAEQYMDNDEAPSNYTSDVKRGSWLNETLAMKSTSLPTVRIAAYFGSGQEPFLETGNSGTAQATETKSSVGS